MWIAELRRNVVLTPDLQRLYKSPHYRAAVLRKISGGKIQPAAQPRRAAKSTTLCIGWIDGKPVSGKRDGKEWRRCDLTDREVCPCIHCYQGCDSYKTEAQAAEKSKPATAESPQVLARFDQNNLAVNVPGMRFNSSLIEWQGGYLLAFRNGWKGSDIYLQRLTLDLQPHGEADKLDLIHRDCSYGREDPRLFLHSGKLHVAFVGVVGRRRRHAMRTNVLYARISDDFRVEQVFAPQYPQRNDWEKNWSFFSHDGQLLAVYSIAPHRILAIDGDRAELAYETATRAPWSGGEIRGGASPVLHRGEWWHFFHDRIESHGQRIYGMGCAVFEDEPPFRVLRVTPDPLMRADPATKPQGQYASVVFPCGTVPRERDWLISMGVHDRWTELHTIAANDIERRMVEIAPAAPASRDVVIGAAFAGGPDPFGSAAKLGCGVSRFADLDADGQRDYLRPFTATVQRWAVRSVLLHDGLSDVTLADAGPCLRVHRSDRLDNFAARWSAFRDYLTARPEIRRAWLIDANDVAFVVDPFAWLEQNSPDSLAVGVEPRTYAENPYFAEHLAPLPEWYSEILIGRHGNSLAWNCGCIGGTRAALLGLLSSLITEIGAMQASLERNPPDKPVMMEMLALGYIILGLDLKVATFRMDGVTPLDGVPSPLIHDRKNCRTALPD